MEISSFTAVDEPITLRWRTESETNNLGFNVYRRVMSREGEAPAEPIPAEPFAKVNATLIKGAGTDATPHEYQFVDDSAVSGVTYHYYLEDVDLSGKTHKSGILTVRVGHGESVALPGLFPTQFRLLPNFPNPFNPETWMPFELPLDAGVSLEISDARGGFIRRLELGQKGAGYYVTRDAAAYWDGRNARGEPVASGVYFYTLHAGPFTATRKMVLMK